MKKLVLALSLSMIAFGVAHASFLDSIKSAASTVKDSLTGAANKVTGEVKNVITSAQTKIMEITNTINTVINDIKAFIAGLVGEIQEVIAAITGTVNTIKKTSITKKDGNPIDTLVKTVQKIPKDIQKASEQPIKDLTTTTKDFERNIKTNVDAFVKNINASVSIMRTGISTAESTFKAGDIQNGIPQVVDTFGNSVTAMVTAMTNSFAAFGAQIQTMTTSYTKAIRDLVNNTMAVNWQDSANAGIAIATDITTIFEAVHGAVTELNHAVDRIGQNSLKLAGDFTDTSSAQESLNKLTGQEDGQIKTILDDIHNIEGKITSAIKDIQDYIVKAKPAAPAIAPAA